MGRRKSERGSGGKGERKKDKREDVELRSAKSTGEETGNAASMRTCCDLNEGFETN